MQTDQIAGFSIRAFRLPDHVVYRSFALETVVVNLERGVYHGLNPTAGRMLESLERAPSARVAARSLADELGEPVERIEADLAAFTADLLDRGLIESRPMTVAEPAERHGRAACPTAAARSGSGSPHRCADGIRLWRGAGGREVVLELRSNAELDDAWRPRNG